MRGLHLLLLQPEVCQLFLVLTVQSFELLAALFEVVVLSDKLGVLPPDGLHLLLQLGLFAQDAAVQHTGERKHTERSSKRCTCTDTGCSFVIRLTVCVKP